PGRPGEPLRRYSQPGGDSRQRTTVHNGQRRDRRQLRGRRILDHRWDYWRGNHGVMAVDGTQEPAAATMGPHGSDRPVWTVYGLHGPCLCRRWQHEGRGIRDVGVTGDVGDRPGRDRAALPAQRRRRLPNDTVKAARVWRLIAWRRAAGGG